MAHHRLAKATNGTSIGPDGWIGIEIIDYDRVQSPNEERQAETIQVISKLGGIPAFFAPPLALVLPRSRHATMAAMVVTSASSSPELMAKRRGASSVCTAWPWEPVFYAWTEPTRAPDGLSCFTDT